MAKPTDLINIKYTCTKPSPGKYNITLFLRCVCLKLILFYVPSPESCKHKTLKTKDTIIYRNVWMHITIRASI